MIESMYYYKIYESEGRKVGISIRMAVLLEKDELLKEFELSKKEYKEIEDLLKEIIKRLSYKLLR